MSRLLKLTLLIYGIVTFVFGAPLLVAPGRFLGLFGWAPVEPLLCRLLGAALLGMTWGALRAWREAERERSILLAESYAAFNLLGAVGFGRHLLGGAWYPFMVWLVFGLLVLFGVVWLVLAVIKPAK